jgi:hypothetical protein
MDVINKHVNELEALIAGLSSKVSRHEALNLSRSSIDYSLFLSEKYKAISSPWIQNTLVNIGIKERGLCHEWAEDLLKYLVQRNYKTLELHAIGANIGYMNEHNALSVSAKGEGIENSIILDAWRNSGNLYFKKLRKDKKYEWQERRGLYGVLPLKSGK